MSVWDSALVAGYIFGTIVLLAVSILVAIVVWAAVREHQATKVLSEDDKPWPGKW